MKRLHIAELLTVLAVLAFVLWPGREPAKVVIAPESKPVAVNPACRTMRNSVLGAPFLPEPNRDDMRKAQMLWGGDPSYLGNSGYARVQYAQAFTALQKIDSEGTDALARLPSDEPALEN